MRECVTQQHTNPTALLIKCKTLMNDTSTTEMYQKTRKWSALGSDVQPLYTHHLNIQDSGKIGRDEVWRHIKDKQASRADGARVEETVLLRKRTTVDVGKSASSITIQCNPETCRRVCRPPAVSDAGLYMHAGAEVRLHVQ